MPQPKFDGNLVIFTNYHNHKKVLHLAHLGFRSMATKV